MPPTRVLMLMGQSPYDASSGAAITMLAIARILARYAERFVVRTLCTTATEAARPELPMVTLSRAGVKAQVDNRGAVGKGRPVIRWRDRAIEFAALDAGTMHPRDWDPPLRPQFNSMLGDELERFTPQVVFTFGGLLGDQVRRAACRAAGAAVVFAIHNTSYLHHDAFQDVSAVWACSRFVAGEYERVLGVKSTVIYPPLGDEEALREDERTRERCVWVNPSAQKGAGVMARVINELARRRPEIPLEIVEARSTAAEFLAACAAAGLDVSRHPNLLVTPMQAKGRDVQKRAKVMLMPSTAEEAFGRVAAESMVHGTPALVSYAGGLPEAVGWDRGAALEDVRGCGPAAGFALAVPTALDRPASVDDVEPWIAMIERLHDDRGFYAACIEATRGVAGRFAGGVLEPAYVEFFERVAREGGAPRGALPEY